MNVTLSQSQLQGSLAVVSSKSLSHRALIAAGLAQGISTIHNLLDCDDLTATKNALKALGVRIEKKTIYGGTWRVKNSTIDAKESGSTLRFMIPIALLLDKPITFMGRKRLVKRPLDVYQDIFKTKVKYQPLSKNSLPLKVQGPLQSDHFTIPGNVSSQFISGLLFALPLLNGDSVLNLSTPLESKGYVDLTLDTLKSFGIDIKVKDNCFMIPGKQTYKPQDVTIEGDFSQAAFFMVAALLNGDVKLKNLNPNSKQGDKAIVDIIKKMGGDISYDDAQAWYHIKASKTKGTDIDLAQIPDLGPILMILAALSKGVTTFTSIDRLRIKESDRAASMIDILTTLGVKTTLNKDTLTIQGTKQFQGHHTFKSYDDHRIVMALSIAALKADGPITIKQADAINKSYPKFFDDYQTLGGIIQKDTMRKDV